jgi:5-methylcytosine-specific restriction endonuclease McrA
MLIKSLNTRNNKGQFIKGHIKSKAMLEKISKSLKGRTVWNKGLKGVQIAWNKGINNKPRCLNCDKKLTHYESKRCRRCANLGSLSPSWRGGISRDKNKYNREYKKENRNMFSFYEHKRKMLKRNVTGTHTLKQWQELKKQYNYMCLNCGKSESEIKLTEDHILPLSKGGTDNIENIQPLCRSCNSIKHTKKFDYRINYLC